MSPTRKDKPPIPTEKQVQAAILDAAKLCDWKLWHIDAGAANRVTRGKSYGPGIAPPGFPDLIGMTKAGTFAGIEVKRPRTKPRPDQIEWMQLICRSGGYASWFSCAQEAYRWMCKINNLESRRSE